MIQYDERWVCSEHCAEALLIQVTVSGCVAGDAVNDYAQMTTSIYLILTQKNCIPERVFHT